MELLLVTAHRGDYVFILGVYSSDRFATDAIKEEGGSKDGCGQWRNQANNLIYKINLVGLDQTVSERNCSLQ